ncbi:hypothetical protein GCM10029978_082100 [Actinoallomurus acanthiterrae]
MQLPESDLAAPLLLFPRDGEFLPLVLKLASLKEESHGDPDERDAGEEDTGRVEGLSYLRPAAECRVVGTQEQGDGHDDTGSHYCQADQQGSADGCRP